MKQTDLMDELIFQINKKKTKTKLCTNKNRSYKHNEQINKQNIDFGVKFVKIYREMTSQ
jgi:translation elongation factor EF-1beta